MVVHVRKFHRIQTMMFAFYKSESQLTGQTIVWKLVCFTVIWHWGQQYDLKTVASYGENCEKGDLMSI